MKVHELMRVLGDMPADAEVKHLWDGSTYTTIQHVWLARGGHVVTADEDQDCYDEKDRPLAGPSVYQKKYWRTPNLDAT